MKNVCVVMTAVTVSLASALWLPGRPASGQSPTARTDQSSALRTEDAGSADPFRSLLNRAPEKVYVEIFQTGAEANMAHHEASQLLRSYSQAKDEKQRDKLKAQLSKALEKEFDLKQKYRRLELDWADSAVKKAREVLGKRAEQRQTIIEKRLDDLLKEADGLGWTEPSGVGRTQARETQK
jgi:hypothetical protein